MATQVPACFYGGVGYPEGTRAEARAVNACQGGPCLCLPGGICGTLTVVLPVYQCVAGAWTCVSFCPAP